MSIPVYSSLTPHEGAYSNNIRDGGRSTTKTKPVKIDWEFAQRELRDAATSIKNGSWNNTDVEHTTNKMASETDGLVEQELHLDELVDGNASAKPEAPEHREEDVAQQPQLAEGANRVEREGKPKGDAPSPDGGPSAEAPETSGSSEMVGVDTSPSPGALAGEISPAMISPSEETSQPVSASTPGAPVSEPAPSPSPEAINKPEEYLAPQTPESASATPVLPEPTCKCDTPLAKATTAPAEEGASSNREIADTLPTAERGTSPAMAAVAAVAQTAEPPDTALKAGQPSSEKCGGREIPTKAGLPKIDPDERATPDRPACNADATTDDGRHIQATLVAPPSQPPPLPPSSPKAGGHTEAELTATTKAIQANKATLMELQRAREAWRGAEGELERSQEERDELRATLQAVGAIPSL